MTPENGRSSDGAVCDNVFQLVSCCAVALPRLICVADGEVPFVWDVLQCCRGSPCDSNGAESAVCEQQSMIGARGILIIARDFPRVIHAKKSCCCGEGSIQRRELLET